MLPINLLIARSRAGKIRPVYTPVDNKHICLASELIETFFQHMGRKKKELSEALDRFEGLGYDYRLIRGLITLLDRRCTFQVKTFIESRTARRAIFAEANEYPLVATEKVKQNVLSKVASRLKISPQQLEASLWSDMDQELILKEFNPYAPEDLLKLYNLSLTQTLLFRATIIEFQTGGNYKEIFRRIKLLGLMYTLEKEDGAIRVAVSGPMALFKLTERYGTALAKLFPKIVEAEEWELKASIVAGERHSPRILQLELDSGGVDGMIASFDSEPRQIRVFDSSVEEKFSRSFEALGTGWTLRREPEPLVVGRHIMIPDFSFEKDDMKAYLEIVGFWTEDYLMKKIQKLKKINVENMIIAVDKSLSCSRIKRLGMEVVLYEREVPVRPIMEYLRGIEEANLSQQVDRLSGIELRLQEDIVDVEKVGNQLQKSKEAVKRWLQTDPPKGYRLIGDILVSENKLDEIDQKVSRLHEAKLSTVIRLIQDMGMREPHRVLNVLGYEIRWQGLDQDRATILKNKKSK